MKRVWVFISVGVLLMGMIGCGGNRGSDTTISKAEFANQAEAICSKAEKKKESQLKAALKAYEEFGQKTKTQEEQQLAALVTDAVLPALSRMSEELGDLGAPETNAAEAEAMVEAFEMATVELEERPTAAGEGKFDPFQETADLSGKLGLKACAEF